MQGQLIYEVISINLTRLFQLKKPRRDRSEMVRARFFIYGKLAKKLRGAE